MLLDKPSGAGTKAKRLAILLLFIAFLAAVAAFTYKQPAWGDWDRIAYIGCVLSLHESNPAIIHAGVYEQARRELPQDAFHEISAHGSFREDVAKNPYHFVQQLPFYSIRPGYLLTLDLLHRLGFTYIQATRLLSSVPYALLGMVLFVWTRKYVGETYGAVGSGLVMISGPILAAARAGSPSALSALLVVLALYLILEQSALCAGLLLLLASLYVRTDNIVFLVAILAYCVFIAPPLTKLTKSAALVLLALGAIVVSTINHYAGSYGYSMLLRNTLSAVPNPNEFSIPFWGNDYLRLWIEQIPLDWPGTSLALFALLGLIVLFSNYGGGRIRNAVIIALAALAAQVALYPHVADRYFLAHYSIIAISGIASLKGSPSGGDFSLSSSMRSCCTPMIGEKSP